MSPVAIELNFSVGPVNVILNAPAGATRPPLPTDVQSCVCASSGSAARSTMTERRRWMVFMISPSCSVERHRVQSDGGGGGRAVDVREDVIEVVREIDRVRRERARVAGGVVGALDV